MLLYLSRSSRPVCQSWRLVKQCAESRGVFSRSVSSRSLLLGLHLSDPHHDICLRDCPHSFARICHRLCLPVLGYGHSPVVRSTAGGCWFGRRARLPVSAIIDPYREILLLGRVNADRINRLPFSLQWIWPLPLCLGAYFCPESPWNLVRRNKPDLARQSLMRLRGDSPNKETEVEATLAYIRHTTELEMAETEGATILECFKGVNLRRTEIVSEWPIHRHLSDLCRTASSGCVRYGTVTH